MKVSEILFSRSDGFSTRVKLFFLQHDINSPALQISSQFYLILLALDSKSFVFNEINRASLQNLEERKHQNE